MEQNQKGIIKTSSKEDLTKSFKKVSFDVSKETSLKEKSKYDTNFKENFNFDPDQEFNSTSADQITNVRMYRNKFPDEGSLAVIRVKRLDSFGVYVELLEYANIEGLIQLSEISRHRIRSVINIMRIGSIEIARVMRVDKNKGYVDLSKSKVTLEESEEHLSFFAKSKTVHSIFRHVATKLNIDLEKDLYDKFGWSLYTDSIHAHDVLQKMANLDEKGVDHFLQELKLTSQDKKVLDCLCATIKHRLRSKPSDLRADIKLTCFGPEGIDAIKSALKAGQEVHTNIKACYTSAPFYYLIWTASPSINDIEARRLIERSLKLIEETIIMKDGGYYELVLAPRVVDLTDSVTLEDLIKKDNKIWRRVGDLSVGEALVSEVKEEDVKERVKDDVKEKEKEKDKEKDKEKVKEETKEDMVNTKKKKFNSKVSNEKEKVVSS